MLKGVCHQEHVTGFVICCSNYTLPRLTLLTGTILTLGRLFWKMGLMPE